MQRYFAKDLKQDIFLLDEKDYHHIKNVMRMKEAEKIEVVYENTLYLACIQNVKGNPIVCMQEKLAVEKKAHPEITLFIPFLHEQKIDFILQKATELGVFKICFIPLERSVIKHLKEKEEKKKIRWLRIMKEASEQSKRLSIPEIEIINTLEDLKELNGLNLVCSTKRNVENLKKVMNSNSNYDKINIVIGPEGGITEEEENLLVTFGFKSVSLGTRILRVETVPLYVLSVLNYQFME